MGEKGLSNQASLRLTPLTAALRRSRFRDHSFHGLVCIRENLAATYMTCKTRHAASTAEEVDIKAWFEFWQFECGYCHTLFASTGGPVLSRFNPAREAPTWFNQILPHARIGRKHLADFARRPSGSILTPTSVLNLLSMRLNVHPSSLVPRGQFVSQGWADTHHIAELFLPVPREQGIFGPLISESWRLQKPVRRVTDRTILLAGMAMFLSDSPASFRLVMETSDTTTLPCINRWMIGLPPHARDFLTKQI